MGIEIIEVKTKKVRDRFIQFPHNLYRSDSNFVGELNVSVKDRITDKNPFLKNSKIVLFLAVSDNKDVGRIAAIRNNIHLDIYKDNSGFFGFFDSINNLDVAKALFNAASSWLKKEGILTMVGPTNLTTNDSCGILIKGFEYSNIISMPYNFNYYNILCLECGFEKVTDLYSYKLNGELIVKKYGNSLSRSLKSIHSKDIVVRPLSGKNFKDDLKKLRIVYNNCNTNNWGFMPLNDEEFLKMAKELKLIAPLDLALVVEKDDKFIGFVLAVPDLNQAVKYVINGKLFPLGLLRLLWYKRKINRARLMILGVLKEHSGQGIDLILYHKITQTLNSHNIYEAEACFVLENNIAMNSILKKIGGECIKEYRMYRKELT